MPYSRHLKEKTRIGKKNSRKRFPCLCAICSFESTQSENVIKRHLETFGRCDSELLKSDTDEETIDLDLAGEQRDDIGNNLPDPSSSDTDETVRKRRRTTHVNCKKNDHDCELELNIDPTNTCTTSDNTESEKKSSHYWFDQGFHSSFRILCRRWLYMCPCGQCSIVPVHNHDRSFYCLHE